MGHLESYSVNERHFWTTLDRLVTATVELKVVARVQRALITLRSMWQLSVHARCAFLLVNPCGSNCICYTGVMVSDVE